MMNRDENVDSNRDENRVVVPPSPRVARFSLVGPAILVLVVFLVA
jgi:hypothetical protein